ncbi:hypothetical protein ACYOEI_29485 [Singulisphaera rosea]
MTAPRKPQTVDLLAQLSEQMKIEVRSAETTEERQSRLRREEAEDLHKQRISLIVHVFVMVMVTIGFAVSAYIAITRDPKTGLPDKALGIITAIVAAAFGYMTGKSSK